MTNKYLEKIAFARLSEASFKNLTDEEKAQVHHYITHEAGKDRKEIIASRTIAGGAAGGALGFASRGRWKAGTIGMGLGAAIGHHYGNKKADQVKAKRIDETLNNANLASVLRQPVNGK